MATVRMTYAGSASDRMTYAGGDHRSYDDTRLAVVDELNREVVILALDQSNHSL